MKRPINKNKNWHRRSALQALTLGRAATFGNATGLNGRFLSRMAQAQAAEPGAAADDERYFVFVYFSGAWDILLSLDPVNRLCSTSRTCR